jgi:hypothetical protein
MSANRLRNKLTLERNREAGVATHCALCGVELDGYAPGGGGNGFGCNPFPLLPDDPRNYCCDRCNRERVQPARARWGRPLGPPQTEDN